MFMASEKQIRKHSPYLLMDVREMLAVGGML